MKGQFIAAIAGSAGSHERILEFFDHTPHDDVSYVILQHMPALWQSELSTILARHTNLSIREIRQGMVLHKDVIYIAPPGDYVTIQRDIFSVTPRTGRVHETADTFMSSLATNSRRRAIGIVIEGALSDGTRGLSDIHAAGGFTIVQDPNTCRFCSMPESAIHTGVIDKIAAIEAMPTLVHAYVREVQTHTPA
jgi:two-component system CheB/CheR fusion protein